jgi:hypothetical protein
MTRRISPQLLLESARHEDDPSPGVEERVRIRLMQRLAAGASAGAVIAKGSSAAATLVKTVAIGCAFSAAIAVAVFSRPASAPTPSLAAAVHSAPHAANERALASPPAPAIAHSADARPELSGRVLATPSQPSSLGRLPNAPLSAQAEQRDPLLAEAAGLRAAHLALQQGRAAAALQLWADQERQFAGGTLAEERALVRILALCRLGSHTEASAARERFLIQFPRSPLVPRVRALCGSAAR